jgi:hypothetical protein
VDNIDLSDQKGACSCDNPRALLPAHPPTLPPGQCFLLICAAV